MQKDEIRERLAEIIWDVDFKEMTTVWCGTARNATYVKADWMMERGVTIAEDTNVPTNDVPDTDFGKWIPVSERLPEDCETVLVYAVGYMELGWYDTDNGEWRSDEYTWDADEVTHWLPLPQTPKEENV